MEQFQTVLEDCGLSDMEFLGSKYTWTNGQQGGNFMQVWLDRAVANGLGVLYLKMIEVCVLAARTSDHKPVMVRSLELSKTKSRFYRSFKFEAH